MAQRKNEIGEKSGRTVRVGVLHEFRDFLKEYKIIGLAIGFIMGGATTAFVQALVRNIIMPIITPLMPGEEWRTAILRLGPISLEWGAFLAALIDFVILAIVVFLFAKFVLREEKVTKK